MSDIYPDTSLRLRRQVSNQEWVNTVARRHRAAFIGSIIFHLYLIFFSPKLQQAPTFDELCTSPVWLWLIGSILAADWVHCLVWRLRRRKVNSGHLGIMRWTWIDLICILTPVIPAYFFAVHDVLRIIIGLCTVALTCYAMIRGDRILWRYHIEELRAKLFTRLSRGRREVMQNGAWSLGLGLGLVTMLVYNGGQDYTSALPPMPRILRGAYVIFSTAVMIRALFLSFIQVYWQNLEREQIIDHSGFFRKLLRLMRVLPFSFWLTGISFFSAGFFFFTDNGAFVMPAMLCFHGTGCLFIHNAHSHALQREENRIMEWLLRHPAIMVVASFMMLIATGTYLLSLPFAAADGMQCLSTVDALFTATSASCVTGLSVITISSALSNEGVFVLAALIQLGGLGIMTISSFVALALGHRMGILESSALADMNGEQMGLHAKKMTRAIVSLTLLIEAIGTLIFLLFFYLKPHYIGGFSLGKALWHSYFMALNAFCNSGFSLRPDSYAAYTGELIPLLNATSLIILGSIGYAVIACCWRRMTSRKRLLLPTHAKITIIGTATIIIASTLLMLVLEFFNPDTLGEMTFAEKVANSLFQTTCTRTAGMNSIDCAKLYSPTQLLFIILMFIGAAPGSTGGGIRITTVVILIMLVKSICKGQRELIINRTTIPQRTVHEAIIVLVLGGGTILFGSFLISIAMPEVTLQRIIFEVTSAMGTVGLSNGLTNSLDNFAKVIFVAIMFMGRIGFLTFLSAVRTSSSTSYVRYPEGKVTIG